MAEGVAPKGLPKNVVSKAEVCRAFKISRPTLNGWIKNLGFPKPIFGIPSPEIFSRSEIEDWLERQKELGDARAANAAKVANPAN